MCFLNINKSFVQVNLISDDYCLKTFYKNLQDYFLHLFFYFVMKITCQVKLLP